MPFLKKTDQVIGFDVLLVLARKWVLVKNIDQRKKPENISWLIFFRHQRTKLETKSSRKKIASSYSCFAPLALLCVFNHSDGVF